MAQENIASYVQGLAVGAALGSVLTFDGTRYAWAERPQGNENYLLTKVAGGFAFVNHLGESMGAVFLTIPPITCCSKRAYFTSDLTVVGKATQVGVFGFLNGAKWLSNCLKLVDIVHKSLGRFGTLVTTVQVVPVPSVCNKIVDVVHTSRRT